MAQYYKLVNVDRQEYVCAKCLGLEGRLREWVLNPHGALLILLMRKSDKTGGGDVTTEQVVLDPFKHKLEDVAEMWARCYSREGVALYLPEDSVIGLWANQSVCVTETTMSLIFLKARTGSQTSQSGL